MGVPGDPYTYKEFIIIRIENSNRDLTNVNIRNISPSPITRRFAKRITCNERIASVGMNWAHTGFQAKMFEGCSKIWQEEFDFVRSRFLLSNKLNFRLG